MSRVRPSAEEIAVSGCLLVAGLATVFLVIAALS